MGISTHSKGPMRCGGCVGHQRGPKPQWPEGGMMLQEQGASHHTKYPYGAFRAVLSKNPSFGAFLTPPPVPKGLPSPHGIPTRGQRALFLEGGAPLGTCTHQIPGQLSQVPPEIYPPRQHHHRGWCRWQQGRGWPGNPPNFPHLEYLGAQPPPLAPHTPNTQGPIFGA